MPKMIILILFFFTSTALGNELPNELFDIKLQSNISSLNGKTTSIG